MNTIVVNIINQCYYWSYAVPNLAIKNQLYCKSNVLFMFSWFTPIKLYQDPMEVPIFAFEITVFPMENFAASRIATEGGGGLLSWEGLLRHSREQDVTVSRDAKTTLCFKHQTSENHLMKSLYIYNYMWTIKCLMISIYRLLGGSSQES